MKKGNLNIEKAYFLLKEEGVPPHIIRHSEIVALISVFIGCLYKKVGKDLNLRLLAVGGLLHDIKKHESLKSGRNHALLGYEFLKELGFTKEAEIVKYHVYLKPYFYFQKIGEKEVVYYADKRVKHEEIVSLKERFKDLKVRYGRNLKTRIKLSLLGKATEFLEKKIFKEVKEKPEVIDRLIVFEVVRGVLEEAVKDCSACWRNLF